MFDFSGSSSSSSISGSLVGNICNQNSDNLRKGNNLLRRPLRISRLLVLKNLGPQLIPFTQSTCIYFVLFLPHDAVSAVACFIKCLPILSLCCFVVIHGNILTNNKSISPYQPSATYSRLILAGLIWSGLGDAFLQFSALGFFLPGMAAFGIAHLCYAVAFGLQPIHPESGVVIFTLASAVFACLLPYMTGIFPYAVGIYLVLVCTMGWRAIARVPFLNDLWTWTKLASAVGAMLFCLSDLMIAIKLFYCDFPLSQVLIMTTYYVGQMGIAVSVVEGQLRPPPSTQSSRSPSPPPTRSPERRSSTETLAILK